MAATLFASSLVPASSSSSVKSSFNEVDNLEARRLYEQAVALDPDYARAYVGLALTYLIERYEGWGATPEEEAIIRAQEQAAKAVQVNPTSHSAWLIQGMVQRERGNIDQSVQSMKRAVVLNPNDVDSYVFLAVAKNSQGEVEESLQLIELAFELSTRPTNWHKVTYGSTLYSAKRYEEALAALQTINIDGMPMAQRLLAISYAQLGKTRECGEMAEKFLKRYPGFSIAEHMTKHIIERDDQREHYIDGLKKACFPD